MKSIVNKINELEGKNKIKYNVRLEEKTVDKIKELSNILNVNHSELVRVIINKYFEDKTVYNTYLDTFKASYINLPLNILVKQYCINHLINFKEERLNNIIDLVKEDHEEEIIEIEQLKEFERYNNINKEDTYYKYFNPSLNTKKTYKILRVPNNLDTFNYDLNTYCKDKRKDKHEGIELFIEPDLKYYTTNYLNCLYCLYFEVKEKNYNINLLNVHEASQIIVNSNNTYLKKLFENIYTDLVNANSEDLEEIANKYNTNNILNIEKSEEVTTIKLSETEDSRVYINYFDKGLLKEFEELKKENKELKKRVDELTVFGENKEQITKNIQKETKRAINIVLSEYFPEENKEN